MNLGSISRPARFALPLPSPSPARPPAPDLDIYRDFEILHSFWLYFWGKYGPKNVFQWPGSSRSELDTTETRFWNIFVWKKTFLEHIFVWKKNIARAVWVVSTQQTRPESAHFVHILYVGVSFKKAHFGPKFGHWRTWRAVECPQHTRKKKNTPVMSNTQRETANRVPGSRWQQKNC